MSLVIAVIGITLGRGHDLFGFAFAWGIAIAVVATIQMIVALYLEHRYDRSVFRPLLIGALFPIAYWLSGRPAAIRSETVAFVQGPRDRRVVWNIPREQIGARREVGEAPSRRGL